MPSFRVRDFIANRTRRSRKVLPRPRADPEVIGVQEALEEQSRELRARMPRLFRKVDRTLARPDRVPQHIAPFDPPNVAECAWCGELFSAERRPRECCSSDCRRALRRFRKRSECAWCGRSFVRSELWVRCCSKTCAGQLHIFEKRRR